MSATARSGAGDEASRDAIPERSHWARSMPGSTRACARSLKTTPDGDASLPAAGSVIELIDGVQPLRWLAVRASVQCIDDPGASCRSTQNALALGTRVRISF